MLPVSRVASLVFVLPLLSLVVVSILLGEGHLTRGYFVLGAACIVSSSIVAQRSTQIAGAIERATGRAESKRV